MLLRRYHEVNEVKPEAEAPKPVEAPVAKADVSETVSAKAEPKKAEPKKFAKKK